MLWAMQLNALYPSPNFISFSVNRRRRVRVGITGEMSDVEVAEWRQPTADRVRTTAP